MDKIKDKIEYLKRYIRQTRKVISLLNILGKNENNIPNGVWIGPKGDQVLISAISTLEKLHEIRIWLKESLGDWNDHLRNIWYSTGVIIAAFTNEDKSIELWLETKPEDFPSELQSNNCKVVRIPDRIEPQYAYVCNGEK